jgi:hypothetical protein
MRLNWFSPLPPDPGEGAAYTRRLLPLLQQHARVTLWTGQADWSQDLEAWAVVRRFHAEAVPWADLNGADATIYHPDAGNSEVSRRHPGIVVLHGDGVVERALAVLTHSRAAFERHRAQACCPVVYTPSPLEQPEAAEQCVAVLLRLAAATARCQTQLLAHELASRAAGELAAWTNAATAQAELRQVAQAIHDVTVGAA